MADAVGWKGLDYDASGTYAPENVVAWGEEYAGLLVPGYELRADGGSFVVGEPVASPSRLRLVCRGSFVPSVGTPRDAVAYLYLHAFPEFFASDISTLSVGSSLGVGPDVYCIGHHTFEGSYLLPFVVAEDVGDSLRSEEFKRWYAGLEDGDRKLARDKIAFDVMVQLWSMHSAGIYHCDIKEGNVCVRRRDGGGAGDLHATLIDFDSSTRDRGSNPDSYHTTYDFELFHDIPKRLGTPEVDCPSPLELDMACFSRLFGTLGDAWPASQQEERSGLPRVFGYCDSGVFARRFDLVDDIIPLAERLGLDTVASLYSEPLLVEFIERSFNRSGYLDWFDIARIERSNEHCVYAALDSIARSIFEFYKDAMRTDGRAPDFEDFDDQPMYLQKDNCALARRLLRYIESVGLLVVPADRVVYEEDIVLRLTDSQVEYLARSEHEDWCRRQRASGRTYGKEKTDKTHPLLVSWDELDSDTEDGSEPNKNLNRRLVAATPQMLAEAGLSVVKRR